MFARTLGLAFWMAIASIAGFWLHPQSGMLLGAFLVCLWVVLRDLWKGQKLTHWLRHNNVQEPPEMGGIWGDLIDRMKRILNEQRKQTKHEQQKLQDFLLAIQASPNGVVLLDPEGRIEWSNQTAANPAITITVIIGQYLVKSSKVFGESAAEKFGQSLVNSSRVLGVS